MVLLIWERQKKNVLVAVTHLTPGREFSVTIKQNLTQLLLSNFLSIFPIEFSDTREQPHLKTCRFFVF